MKFLYSLFVLLCLVLLISQDVNSLSIDNKNIEANKIDKRSPGPKKASEKCGKNELFNDCASSCEKSCDDINNDDHSSGERCVGAAVCNKKCVCKDGYVRDSKKNGKCIRYQECPRVKH